MKIKNLQQLKEIIINEIKPYIIDKGKTPWQFKSNKDLFNKLNQKYENSFKVMNELIFLCRNYNNLDKYNIFCLCGNKNHSLGLEGYTKHCSVKCCTNDKNYQEKLKLSKLNNIDSNGLNSYQRQVLKSKQTKKIRYGNENYTNKEKTKRTCINKYGVDNPWKSKDIINKMNNTKLNNIDSNGLNSYQRGRLKQKQNFLKKYGVDSYFKTQEFKNKFKDKIFKDKFLNKQYDTKRINNTFNTSKPEEKCYDLLLIKFKNIKRQYKSNLYPFNCDFYIEEKDLYIECHFSWLHNRRPFDKNNIDHIKEQEYFQNKSNHLQRKNQYQILLDTWTKRDVLKLQTFIKNKLNYKIFYNFQTFLNWYNSL